MNSLARVAARIDWPQFFLTTIIGVVIGWYISKTLDKAAKGNISYDPTEQY